MSYRGQEIMETRGGYLVLWEDGFISEGLKSLSAAQEEIDRFLSKLGS